MVTATATKTGSVESERPVLSLPRAAWRTPLLYMLCMAALGLSFYPALLLLVIFWLNAWNRDRYDLLIQFTLFAGGYGMLAIDMFPVWTCDLALGLSVILWFIYRKPPVLRRTLVAILVYFTALFIFAFLSRESIKIQLLIMRNYFGIAYIIVPFAAFANREFDIRTFFTHLAPYVFILCAFYISDALIVPGNLLVPATTAWNGAVSTFWDPYFIGFGNIMRKYPPGMYVVALLWLPVIRIYRLRPWQWALLILGIAVTQTFTAISGFLSAWVLFQPNRRRIMTYILAGVGFLIALYALDCILPSKPDPDFPTERTTLRIKSSVDQFTALSEAIDDEDVAQFGSGRVAQILPKVELMERQHKMMTGLGFLHPEKTKIQDFIIFNEYYSDVTVAEEVAAAVEVTQVQTFIQTGWLGVAVQFAFFLALYLFIRRNRYRSYYVCALFMMAWFGLGGFGGWVYYPSLFIIAVAYAVTIMAELKAPKAGQA